MNFIFHDTTGPALERGDAERTLGPGTLTSSPLRPTRSQVAALLGATLATSMSNLAQTTVLGLLVYELTGSELYSWLPRAGGVRPRRFARGGRRARRRPVRPPARGRSRRPVERSVALVMAWYVRDPHGLSTTPIFLLVIAFGAGQAFLAPALRSIPPAMVPNAGVPWLVARRSIASEVATIIGPILGGLLYVAGVWVALVAVAALSFIGGAAILAIRIPDEERLHTSELSPVGDDEVGHVLEEGIPASRGGVHEAMEGLRYVRATPILLGAISLDLFAVLFGGAVTLLPAIAVRLHVGPVGLGWLRASVGLGAGAATLLISFRPIERRVGPVLLAAVAFFGVWTIVLGLARSYALAFVAIFALSAADAVSVFIRSTLVPLATPPAMRGRVLAVENVFIGASNQLGGFESGARRAIARHHGLGRPGWHRHPGRGAHLGYPLRPLRQIDRFPTPPSAVASGGEVPEG